MYGKIIRNDDCKVTSYVIDDNLIYCSFLEYLKNYPRKQSNEIERILFFIIYYLNGMESEYNDILESFKEKLKDFFTETKRNIDEDQINQLIRLNFGKEINKYLYLKSRKKDLSQKEYMEYSLDLETAVEKYQNNERILCQESKAFYKLVGTPIDRTEDEVIEKLEKVQYAPINISEIRGLKLGMCLERAILFQNISSFLGYNTYCLSGTLKEKNNNDLMGHAWNVIEQDGKYYLFDTSAYVFYKFFENVKSPKDLIKFGNRVFKNMYGEKMIYKSFYETEPEWKKITYIGKESEFKKIAYSGMNYRFEANKYFERLALYAELRNNR